VPPRLRNPLRGSWHPQAVARRLTDFLLLGLLTLFVGTNRRIFRRIVTRQTGLADPRALPTAHRRLAFGICGAGTIFLFLAIIYLFASSWNTVWAGTAAAFCYFATTRVLQAAMWGWPVALAGHTRFAGMLRRLREVIRHGAP